MCSYHDEAEGIDLRGHPVTPQDCCAAWDAPGTKRPWKQKKKAYDLGGTMSTHVPDEAEERRLIGLTKQAVALVDEQGLSPNAAIEKVAREGNLGRGGIDLLAYAYNTGRQLGQFKQANSILEKLADFELADPEKVAAAIYPEKVMTPKEAADCSVVSGEYSQVPHWLDEKPARPAMTKAASADKRYEPAHVPEAATTAKKMFGTFEFVKNAYEEKRRLASAAEDTIKHHLAELTGYFKQAECYRLPYAQVEHACRAYLPEADVLLKMAYDRAKLGSLGRREKTAADVPCQKEPFDLGQAPFTTIKAAIEAAKRCNDYRAETARLKTAYDKAAGATIRPFVPGAPVAQAPPSRHSLLPEKKAFIQPALAGAITGMIGRGLGEAPKSKQELIEDAWLDLEDPSHQNEIRKIKQHTLLNQLMTDPDDPISSHDPDKIVSAYNEIASMAPRLAEQPAALRPVLRRKLQGLSEPFEAKEMTDIEKGLAESKGQTPASLMLQKSPQSIMG